MLRDAIDKVSNGRDLDREESRRAALAILEGRVPESVIGGLLVGLKTKGETEAEIAGFAQGLREMKVGISPATRTLVDTCGTGGDRSGTFNISTAAAIVAAGAGVTVAKHGNRGVSSGCGSADVLEALGVDIAMSPEAVEECIETVGLGFMFAPAFHPAMKAVMGARRDLGVPTIFNILGPLANPANARAQVIGVNRADLVPVVGRVIGLLGCDRAFVLHGLDGLDEFTLCGRTRVFELDGGSARQYELEPPDIRCRPADSGALRGGNADFNASIIRRVLGGQEGPALEVTVANAAFAIVAGGAADSLDEGVAAARRAVASGDAAGVLKRLERFGGRRGGR